MTRTCLQCGEQTPEIHCPKDGMATIVQGLKPPEGNLASGTVFASRYRITGILGRGGMGAVYSAQHTGTAQNVAIKTLLLDAVTDLSSVRRFFNEAKLTASLQHPNTIRVFDFGQADDGTYFLAMEALKGETLAEHQYRLLQKGERMPQDEIVKIAIDILRSLAEAHRIGLVHRDLKPANIFLHDMGGGADGSGEIVVKVLDFGIAKMADTHLTRTGTSLGTPSYMSPEQIMGSNVDARADLYALGVILFGCISGELPFQAESSYAMMMQHMSQPPPDLRTLATCNVTHEFAAVVERALAKKPEDRFADAAAMRQALEQCHAVAAALPPKIAATKAYAPNVPPLQAPPSGPADLIDSDTIAAPSLSPVRPTLQPLRDSTESGKDAIVPDKPKMPVAIWVFLALLVTVLVGGGVVVAWYFGLFGAAEAKKADDSVAVVAPIAVALAPPVVVDAGALPDVQAPADIVVVANIAANLLVDAGAAMDLTAPDVPATMDTLPQEIQELSSDVAAAPAIDIAPQVQAVPTDSPPSAPHPAAHPVIHHAPDHVAPRGRGADRGRGQVQPRGRESERRGPVERGRGR